MTVVKFHNFLERERPERKYSVTHRSKHEDAAGGPPLSADSLSRYESRNDITQAQHSDGLVVLNYVHAVYLGGCKDADGMSQAISRTGCDDRRTHINALRGHQATNS